MTIYPPKSTVPSMMRWLLSIRHIPRTCHCLTFLFLCLKNVKKGHWFTSVEEVTAKATSTDRGIKKWFPWMLWNLYECWQKCVATQGNYFEGNVVLTRCITHFCVMNQFWALFEVSSKLWLRSC
jgi:hypothetical protein